MTDVPTGAAARSRAHPPKTNITDVVHEVPANEPAFTFDDLTRRWKCSRSAVYAVIASGKLTPFSIGRARRFTAANVRAYENGEV